VQDTLKGRSKKYNQPKVHQENESFPLRGFIVCPRCGKALTASFSKGNGDKYPYYHCSKRCKERVRAEDVDISFRKFLNEFRFSEGAKELFKRILIENINQSDLNKSKVIKKLDAAIEKNNVRLDILKDKFVDGELSKEEYQQFKQKYEAEKYRLTGEKEELKNFNKGFLAQLDYCMVLVQNLPKFYEKSSIDGKQRLIGSIFTGNLIFKNKKVRTTRVNDAVSLITSINRSYRRLPKEKPGKKSGLSPEVTPAGLFAPS
jgi:site-specific DNA recombinase